MSCRQESTGLVLRKDEHEINMVMDDGMDRQKRGGICMDVYWTLQGKLSSAVLVSEAGTSGIDQKNRQIYS